MSVIDKLNYFFSTIHLCIVYKKLENWFKIRAKGRKHIRLAMVGTAFSGKSFLLQDILTSLKFMGFTYLKGLLKGLGLCLKDMANGHRHKVWFRPRNLGRYLVIQYELWVNTVRRIFD